MNRRDFITLVGSTAAAPVLRPLAAQAKTPERPAIGYFSSRSPDAEAPVRVPFLKALEESGFVVGQNAVIDYRFAEGQVDRLPMFAAEFVRSQVAVIVATDPGSALAAEAATTSIPIVFTSGQDPVQIGLVASLKRPGGNATGVSLFTTALGPKRLELLRELLPQPGLIAFVVDPKLHHSSPFQVKELQAAAETIGQPVLVLDAGTEGEVDKAFAVMKQRQVAALLYGASTFFQVISDKLIALAARYAIPALYEWREFVTAGGLMSYSTSRTEVGLQVGNYVGRILKGAKPADLPVVQSARFEFVLNLKTARALRITLPQSLFARADEVID